jgi:antitoxin component YwqK of YwqJK toxin-antitoxin module
VTGYVSTMMAGLLLYVAASAQHSGFATEPGNDRRAKKIVFVAPYTSPVYSFIIEYNGAIEEPAGQAFIFKAHAKNHRLHGEWRSWYANEQMLDSGQLVNGIPDGEWRYFDSTGQLLSVRHYNADKFRRVKEEWRHPDPRRSFFALTDMYRSNPSAAVYHTRTAYSFPSKHDRVKRSLRETVLLNRTGADAYHPVFDEGLLHGLYLNYFSNGMIRDSGYYKDGLKDGVWVHHNSIGGSWFLGTYKNGLRQYEWKQYDASGKLLSIIFYTKEGKEAWRKDRMGNGQ